MGGCGDVPVPIGLVVQVLQPAGGGAGGDVPGSGGQHAPGGGSAEW